MRLDEFDYSLPAHLIAQEPLPERSASRLLRVSGDCLTDLHFADLPGFLREGDLLVLNDSRVTHARLLGVKETGGNVELLIERIVSGQEVLAQVRASHAPRAGTRLILEGEVDAHVLGREGEFFRLRFPGERPALELIERHGRLPLPPYIDRPTLPEDESRYQTVFARHPGSVAAPTAGLHFDEPLMAALRSKGVRIAFITLHVGAGTFQPVRVEDIVRHRMHPERYSIPEETADAIRTARTSDGRIIAVGSTSLRTLEAAAAASGELRAGEAETALFIYPGYRFQIVDCLITNFHLPRTTLLMLVSAFGGIENIRRAYAHAIERGYRFFSYGDAMFIERAPA